MAAQSWRIEIEKLPAPELQTAQAQSQQSTPLPKIEKPTTGSEFVVAAAAIIVLFFPVLVGLIRDRYWLMLLAFLCCAASAVSLVVGMMLGGVFGFLMFGPVIASTFWSAGLFFGLAAAIDRMAERRARRQRQNAELPPMAPRFR